jgi:magnesium transporter
MAADQSQATHPTSFTGQNSTVIVDCAVYSNGMRRPGALALSDALEASRERGSFVWIGLYEPTLDEFEAARCEFELHPLAVEDAVNAHQRPKIELYDDTLFVVLKTARYDDATESVEFAELQVFVGPSFVVSVRHGVASALAQVRRAIECQPELLRCGPPAVLHAIIDHVVDDYEPVLIGLDKDVREIEAQVFTHEQKVTNPAERIYKLKREVLDFLRNAKPLSESLERLSRQSSQIPDDLTDYFRDVHDHLLRVLARVEDLNVLLSDVLNANLAQVGVRQNDDMRKMSAWLAIGAFPTVVGAIYGMNFRHMPELEHTLGYPIVLALTALVCFGLYRRFKRAHWL